MNTLAHRQLPPTPRDAAIARSTYQALSPYSGADRPLKLRVRNSEQEQPIDLPASAVNLLLHVLEAMAAGQGVTLITGGSRTHHGPGGRRAERLPSLPDQTP